MTRQVFGFSFSLHADGSPGLYNKILAEHILSLDLDDTRLYLQWEIAEALRGLDSARFTALEPRLHVVAPPLYDEHDVQFKNLEFLVDKDIHQIQLKKQFELAEGGSSCDRLNKLISDANLFRQFTGLSLLHLTRPKLGELFTEYRELPAAKNYPNGLSLYQRVRVNRLIVSAVINDGARIKPLPYMSTQDVLEAALNQPTFDKESPIAVIAHPRHIGRCVSQVRTELETRELTNTVEAELIELDEWDSDSAQVWCRSLENWEAYEKTVEKWLSDAGRG